MNPYDLIRLAGQLASGAVGSGIGRPRQVELRRAMSTAYYAMFHALALCCANMVVGSTPGSRDEEAWRQTYRALEHGRARSQCENRTILRFTTAICNFGEKFVKMQSQRHLADYAPEASFEREEVLQMIDEAEQAISEFDALPSLDRRAFAVYLLFRTR